MEIKAKPEETCCPIVELRQYTLHPEKRDVLIDLFDRQFIEPQEALGMKIIGPFRDVDDRKPAVTDTGASILAYFVTEDSKNTFPALPVREDENVFVWFARFNNQAAYELHAAPLARSPRWQDEISEELARPLKRPPEVLKLS